MSTPKTKGKNVSNTAGKINTNVKKTDGVGGSRNLEIVPLYLQSEGEKVIYGQNSNTSIVLGKDRYASIMSGFGANGATQCSAIDIVVGRMSGLEIRELPKINGSTQTGFLYVNSSFEHDAARLYLSEKADIDRYLGLFNSTIQALARTDNSLVTTREAYAKSSAVLLSDHTRIVGRENVKLMTKYAGFNSRSGQAAADSGIHIIAGSVIDSEDYSLQSMVKGENLAEAMMKILDFIEDLGNHLNNFITEQRDFNDNYLKHKHTLEDFWPIFRTSAPIIMDRIEGNIINTEILTQVQRELLETILQKRMYIFNNYLTHHGSKFINSYFNKVN
jgi:hypothetical protein